MINVAEYIKLILKKKGWTNIKLCEELNKIESKIGDTRTTRQNITNYLNGYHNIGPKWLVKVEKALNLENGTLMNLVVLPTTKEAQKELNVLIKKVRDEQNVKKRNISKN